MSNSENDARESGAGENDARENGASPASGRGVRLELVRRHRKRKVAAFVVVLVVVAVAAGLYSVVTWRLTMERRGVGAVDAPTTLEHIDDTTNRTGRFTATVDYTSMAAPADQHVSTEVLWDDDWFFVDPTVYNHELATTCSVLSAIANSESNYYQAGTGAPAYMEEALAQLGFTDVSTASYRYRSEIIDEVVNFLTNTNDVTAYSIATKRVTSSETGASKTLMLVSIRGSYGSEWISDANFGGAADAASEEIDHEGFRVAAEEVIAQLGLGVSSYVEKGGSTDDLAILFCGHSRGGAAANLAAAYADEAADGPSPLASLGSIYCYSFATPRTTTAAHASDARYDNIFNILNPSDLVPRLPLAQWGYARYGRDLWLPVYGSDAFEAGYDEMRRRFLANVGVESPYDPTDVTTVTNVENGLAEKVPTQADFLSVGGVTALAEALVQRMDVGRVLCGHYPNTYIAWMQSVDAAALVS